MRKIIIVLMSALIPAIVFADTEITIGNQPHGAKLSVTGNIKSEVKQLSGARVGHTVTVTASGADPTVTFKEATDEVKRNITIVKSPDGKTITMTYVTNHHGEIEINNP